MLPLFLNLIDILHKGAFMNKSDGTDPTWKRSSLCTNANCVEVACLDGYVLVRDSGHDGPALRFSFEDWSAFIGGVRVGEFDLPRGY
jgi:Domain of unknown function (DUF397)